MKRLALLLLALLLAHALLWGWGQGHFGGQPGSTQREPARLAAQLHPERLQLLSPEAASSALKPLQCREIGQFSDEAQLAAAEAALHEQLRLQPSQWQRVERRQSGLWLIATRAADNSADLERKRVALEKAGVKPQRSQALVGEREASWVVERHEDEAAARAALERLRGKGLRLLRLLPMRLPSSHWWLRLPGLEQGQLKATHPAWPGGLRPCSNASAAAEPASAASAAAAV